MKSIADHWRSAMFGAGNRGGWKPAIWKILGGVIGTLLILAFVFHQPWFPVEITTPETGILAAMPALPSPTQSIRDEKAPSNISLVQSETQSPPHEPERQTAELPQNPRVTSNTWRLGKPTVAYRLPTPFLVPATELGFVWNFVIPTGVNRELYLTGVELKPGNPRLVKRMTLAFDPTGTARKLDRMTSTPGFPVTPETAIPLSIPLGEWTPNTLVSPMPQSVTHRIPAGADLILTIEYAASSQSEPDPWSMGLHLSRGSR